MVMVRYIEIPAADLDRAITFYQTIFDVQLERATVDHYAMAHFPASSDGLGAHVTLAQGDVYVPSKTGPIVYFQVPEIDAVLLRVTGQGKPILYPKTEVAPRTWVAEFEDSEGNRIALTQRADGAS